MREITKKEDKRKENAYDVWSNEVEVAFRVPETHPNIVEEASAADHAAAPDLFRLETQNKEFFDLLREAVAEEDEQLTLPILDIPQEEPTPSPTLPASERRHLSPAWLVAAVFLGFVVGYLMPHSSSTPSPTVSALAADSSVCCRSLTDGDVNTSLLVAL